MTRDGGARPAGIRPATEPTVASSLWKATPPARGRRGRELQAIRAEAAALAEKRRARVLAHEWARSRLCSIFGYRDAAQWTGYVPPKADPLPDRGLQVAPPNDSPFRKALIRLLRDVDHFDRTGEMPEKPAEVEQLAIT